MPETNAEVKKRDSAEKAARGSAKKQLRNKAVRSGIKTVVTRAEKLVAAKDAKLAPSAVTAAVSALDKAVQKGVIHPNKAARSKSRLARKLNKAIAS